MRRVWVMLGGRHWWRCRLGLTFCKEERGKWEAGGLLGYFVVLEKAKEEGVGRGCRYGHGSLVKTSVVEECLFARKLPSVVGLCYVDVRW